MVNVITALHLRGEACADSCRTLVSGYYGYSLSVHFSYTLYTQDIIFTQVTQLVQKNISNIQNNIIYIAWPYEYLLFRTCTTERTEWHVTTNSILRYSRIQDRVFTTVFLYKENKLGIEKAKLNRTSSVSCQDRRKSLSKNEVPIQSSLLSPSNNKCELQDNYQLPVL